jgi:hypothetical protein
VSAQISKDGIGPSIHQGLESCSLQEFLPTWFHQGCLDIGTTYVNTNDRR